MEWKLGRGGGGRHRLDCVLALHPDNFNSCKLNQLSALPRGTTPEETEAMPERTPGEGAKSSGTAVSRCWSPASGTTLRELHRTYGCRCDPGTEGPGAATQRPQSSG